MCRDRQGQWSATQLLHVNFPLLAEKQDDREVEAYYPLTGTKKHWVDKSLLGWLEENRSSLCVCALGFRQVLLSVTAFLLADYSTNLPKM